MKFPLSKHPNGQWCKKIKQKVYYFGAVKDDPTGARALREYTERLPGIHAGTDHLRHLESRPGQLSVGDLMGRFLAQRRLDVSAGTLSKTTYGDYLAELAEFAEWIKPDTAVAALRPEHFAGYVRHLLEVRKLRALARKRVQAYIKAMFRWGAGNGHCPLPHFGTAFKAPATTQEALRKERARTGARDNSKRIATGAEVDKLLAVAQPNFRAMILLAVNCGLGPADLGRLRWRHIQGRKLIYPRHKTGNERVGWLWKRTVRALEEVRRLKHAAAAISKDGEDALVFITRKQQPYYRETERVEGGREVGVVVANAISLTISRLAKGLGLTGLTAYRFRHTFKTLGKRAKDRDALNLMMGHRTNSVEEGYDHEEIAWARIKRVARVVRLRLWPKPKRGAGSDGWPSLRLVTDGGDGEPGQRAVG